MITDTFESLTRAVSSTPAIAILASLGWGVLSILLSPCHLTSIPLIIGFVGEQGRLTPRRAFSLSLLFGGGILITIGVIGVITAALGRMLGDLGSRVNYVLAIVLLVIGLHFLGIIPMPLSASGPRASGRRGMLAALSLGLVFGLAIGPCTFAYMAPILGVTMSVARTNMAYGVLLLAAYGIGHCGVIVAAGTFTEVVGRYRKWTSRSRSVELLRKACGILVIAGGVYLFLA